MSKAEYESERVSASEEGGAQTHVLVPSTQVDTFLTTLQAFSQSCEASRAAVEASEKEVGVKHGDVCDTLRDCEELNSSTKAILEKITNFSRTMEEKLRRVREEVDSVEAERKVVRNLPRKISKQTGGVEEYYPVWNAEKECFLIT